MSWEVNGSVAVVFVSVALIGISLKTVDIAEKDERLRKLQIRYLIVYSLAVCSDWLQGPYMYALYESYGLSVHEINLLFVGGFGASLVAGTIIGSFADKYGRKFNVFLYVALYIASCITKHFSSFFILFLGRITGGIATSILFSAFESWLVHEHKERGLAPELMQSTFSYATICNSAMAITSGFLAQGVVNLTGEFVTSFDASIGVLMLCGLATTLLWKENYGDVDKSVSKNLIDAWNLIVSNHDRRPLYLGIAIALFEAAMYMFVLEWTPALNHAYWGDTKGEHDSLPYGLIFSVFMVSCMSGSVVFKHLTRQGIAVERFLGGAVGVGAVCLSFPVLPGVADNFILLICAFLIFEIVVGIFWPGTATLRSRYLEDDNRCTVMNFYRIPLNLAVIIVLCFDLSYVSVFVLAVTCMVVSAICFLFLEMMRNNVSSTILG